MGNFLSKAAKTLTKVIDNQDWSKFGGELQKAELQVYRLEDGDIVGGGHQYAIPLWINPNSIKVDREVEFKEEPAVHGTVKLKYAQTKPIHLSIGELYFDTYDTRESVRTKYIEKLEELLIYDNDTHVLNGIVFNWGEFSMTKLAIEYVFLMSKLSVDYTLFLPSGMPCRAKASLCMQQVTTAPKESKERSKQSPDHARIHTVKRGETLQSIAHYAYADPGEWRRIATTNRLDDPMMIRPGMKLLLPPILK
ncbi:MAG TPA: LysM peptidoglycan-binding domain-containing protein [Myxococcota bacterium]|nr:LysM peptidoglycan-binding domain-containing protein [Myxococcota bacterium]